MIEHSETRFKVKKLKSGDSNFTFSHDGITLTPRAGLEISQRCPENYKNLILECINHDWIKPVAYMKDSEFIWEKLSND
jgi:hypothetical protein